MFIGWIKYLYMMSQLEADDTHPIHVPTLEGCVKLETFLQSIVALVAMLIVYHLIT